MTALLRRIWTRCLQAIARYAADPGDTEEWRLKKTIGLTLACVSPLIYALYALLYFAFDEAQAGWVTLGAAALSLAGVTTYGVFRHYGVHALYFSLIAASSFFLVTLLLGGIVNSGLVLVWLLSVPILLLVVYELRYGFASFLAAAALVLVAALVQPSLRPANHLPAAVIMTLSVLNIVGVGVYMLVTVYYYVWRNQILSHLLRHEHEKAEALLLNVLPKEIAAILMNENRVVADQFEGASILFADIVNFTPLSATMTPGELVELLNEVFSHFDMLVERYGLEKIKTIGDCYMVAAGVPRPRSDHARVLTRFALDIRDHVRTHTFHGRQLSFRIGLNSGPVVAGVIGRKKFIYDLWGDAVNTASRMESHGAGGFIQITDATYRLIKDEFECEPRGVVSVKGKGEMNVWYVLGKKAASSERSTVNGEQ